MWGREMFTWLKLAVIGLLWSAAGLSAAEVRSEPAAADNEQIVREFVAAWSRLDPDELVSYFADDGTYFNMPTAPVTGHDDLRTFIAGFLASWDETEWEILNLLAEGDIVMVERMDRTVVAGRPVELPCFGLFELENGKIRVWRDYFDLATYVDAISPPR